VRQLRRQRWAACVAGAIQAPRCDNNSAALRCRREATTEFEVPTGGTEVPRDLVNTEQIDR